MDFRDDKFEFIARAMNLNEPLSVEFQRKELFEATFHQFEPVRNSKLLARISNLPRFTLGIWSTRCKNLNLNRPPFNLKPLAF